jgi:hypothetical protein
MEDRTAMHGWQPSTSRAKRREARRIIRLIMMTLHEREENTI